MKTSSGARCCALAASSCSSTSSTEAWVRSRHVSCARRVATELSAPGSRCRTKDTPNKIAIRHHAGW
ncbi:hypothetical protein HaLaN_31478, partial [Haematococcus lacustris]